MIIVICDCDFRDEIDKLDMISFSRAGSRKKLALLTDSLLLLCQRTHNTTQAGLLLFEMFAVCDNHNF